MLARFVAVLVCTTTTMAFAFLQPIQLQMKPKSPLLMAADDDEYYSTQRIKTIVKDTGSSMTERGSVLLETESLELSSAVMEEVQDAVLNSERNTNKKTTIINNLKCWEKRLNTIEDAFSIHKISAVVYTLSSFTLMGTAIYRWVMGRQELFATIPEYLQPVMWAFCISNFFMCSASIRMAILYRANNIASRNAFIGVAGSSLFSTYFLAWASPFAPDQMIEPEATQIGFGILCAWNIVLIVDSMARATELIDDRSSRAVSEEKDNASYSLEYFRYIFSGAWPLPVIVSTGYINAVLYNHEWLINVFDQVLYKDDFGLQASVFYNNVGASMAASYAAFFITLRDKMLISKQVEWVGILTFSLPVLIWTIDVSVRIFPFVLGLVQLE